METFYPKKNIGRDVLVSRTAYLPTVFTATASATPHTKGIYTQVVASTSADVSWVRVCAQNTGVTGTITGNLLDIAVGADGAEVVKVANLNVGWLSATYGLASNWEFPLFIPAGSRVAIRNQAVVVSDTVDVSIDFYYGGRFADYSGAPPVAYGPNTATSTGVSVIAGLSSAEGAWTQITSATTQFHRGLLVSVGGAGDISLVTAEMNFDIGVGTAGNEVAVTSDYGINVGGTEVLTQRPGTSRVDGLNIPPGSALSVRLSSPGGGAQSLDFILHGLG